MAGYALEGTKWGTSSMGTSGGTVTWSFAQSAGQFYQFAGGSVTQAAYQNIIRDAFSAWSKVANVKFLEVTDSTSSNIRIGMDSIDGKSKTLAETYSSWNNGSSVNQTTHSEIRIDTAEKFSTSKQTMGETNLYALMLHEIGHSLGLQHTPGSSSIMNPIIGNTIDLTTDDIAGAQALYGNSIPAAKDLEIVATTYQFFTGSVPTQGGFEYLIDSRSNANDLNDPYYAQFNQENRYINFANNLGSFGDGAPAFQSQYAGLSFHDAVVKAYDTIIGIAYAQSKGIDTDAAIKFFENSKGFYEQVASERITPSGVSLADGTKLAMLGSMMNEAVKSGVGQYAAGVSNFVAEYQDNSKAHFGQSLFTA